MKYAIVFFISFLCFAQIQVSAQTPQNYAQQWEQVKAADKKGLPRTAWNLVNKIYAKADKKGDEQQQIKALIYQLKYRDQIEENADVKNIHIVDSLSQKATGVPKALLQNLSANLYLGYVHRNRYTLLNRTASTAEKGEQLTTWSLTHLYNHIDQLFQKSLQHKDILKTILVKDYTVLADSGKNALSLRPTLYDLLAHNALQFYSSEEPAITRPAQHFVIRDAAAFDPARSFSKHDFSTQDSASLSWRALRLYQDLIQFHLEDKKPDALIDVDLERLQYVFRKAVSIHKDSLYRKALAQIINQYNRPVAGKASWQLAQWYYNKGKSYDAQSNPEHRWALKKALAICKKASGTAVNEGNIECQKLKDKIVQPGLSLNTEQVNVPGKPFRVLVQYKNTKEIWFRLIWLDASPEKVFNQNLDLEQLLQKEILTHWKQDFPLPKDYQQHAAEMKVTALPPGRYVLMASANASFKKGKDPIVYVTFFVSNLSYVTDNNGGYLVLNRETGKPVKKAKVRMWTRHYNASERKFKLQEIGKYKTDQKGYFHLDTEMDNHFIMPEISTKDDHLFIGSGRYIPYVSSSSPIDTIRKSAYLFTDRSIYRPGQTLYFKGLLIQHRTTAHSNSVVKDQPVKIFLFDANNQKVDSAVLKSNDFGSFAGSFILPSALMNGRMRLSIDSMTASSYFSVEDYKRPSYELQWDSTSHAYQLGDSVVVSGRITGYNGAPVGGAVIKYQVSRKPYAIPFFRGNRHLILPPITESIIAGGQIKADTSGHFNILFPALPNEEIASGNRIFNFEIAADVTDPNGESHHYTYQLPIGDKSLILQLGMNDRLNYKNLDTLYLKSTNLNGKFVPVPVALSMYSLKAPDRFIRKRYWSQPDQFLMDKKQYLAYFPHDEYKAEATPANWETGRPVYVSTDTTKANGKIHFYYGELLPGWYLIKVMSKDVHGHFVTDSQYVQVYDPEDHNLPFHQILWSNTNELKGQPGKEVSWEIGSSEKIFVFEESETLHHTGETMDFRLSNKVKKENYSISDSDLGGVLKHYVTVRFNRIFSEDVKIEIPWEKKQLHITYETFRNKLLPGEKETWKMKITGPQQQKADAELLASMYDVSLDYFAPHQWSDINNIYSTLSGKIRWEGTESFSSNSSRQIYTPEPPKYPDEHFIYPSLRDFGYHWGNQIYHFIQYKKSAGENIMIRGMASHAQADQRSTAPSSPKPEAIKKKTENNTETGLPLRIRKDFRETAFFYPQLHTNDSGMVSFSFTAPEALTRWKLMLLAHTKDLKLAYSEREAITQKPLMIQMNAPRFVRQGDSLILSAKVSNLSSQRQSGNALLSFKNTVTGEVPALVDLNKKDRAFNIMPGQSVAVSWKLRVPRDYTDALTYVIKAQSGNFSDGAQDIIPVLTNKARVTESLPLHFSGNGTHELHWKALEKLEDKKTNIQPEGITIEYTGNPIWYAVQALPFLSEETRKSADARYRKIYANALSNYIALQIPHFKDIMQDWLSRDSNALKSPLQKNETLKNVLLEETPWVENAQTEALQKAKIAHWYNDQEAQLRLKASVSALQEMQLSNGGFSWFKDMPDNRLITQQIVSGLGHMKALHAWPHLSANTLRQIIKKAVPYLDARMKEDYNRLQKDKNLKKTIGPIHVQYLYIRSFFPEIPFADSVKTAYHYFYAKARKEWSRQNTYLKAMLALTFHRSDSDKVAQLILRSLSETAIHDQDGGMHWKQSAIPYHWYQAPITTQSLCLEAFKELQADQKTINALRSWLLSQKQTQYWGTGRATANAVYALLLSGSEWTQQNPVVRLQLGKKTYHLGDGNNRGLQYQKVFIPNKEIQPDMKNIKATIAGVSEDQPSWGAIYFQYFENMSQMDKETGNQLHVERQISLESPTPNGASLSPVSQKNILKVGDKVQVRLIVKADRDMDFVHLKDVRASCLEPLQVLSGYQWKNGLGYYTTVTDAAVHFYFSHLPKGTYVFTYPAYITQRGSFTAGLSTIECLYAPEIRAHSEGARLQVK